MAKITDMQKQVTAKIISSLESGVKPWVMPWNVANNNSFLPFNAATGKTYRGINIMLLWMEAEERRTGEQGWVTFNQAKAKGWSVRKGSKGAKVCFYNTGKKDIELENGETKENTYRFLKWFTVFNMSDIETGEGEAPLTQPSAIAFNELAEIYSENTGVEIRRGGDVAAYSPMLDLINIPESQKFHSEDDYAATLAHEIVHSTKTKGRTGRRDWLESKYSDKEERYAFEELVAELGAAFMGAEGGFSGDHLQHDSYIASWLKVLKGDKTAIFKAATKASQACDFFHSVTDIIDEKAA